MNDRALVGSTFLEFEDFHLFDKDLQELPDSVEVLGVGPGLVIQGRLDDTGLVVHEEEGLFGGLNNLVAFFFEVRVFLLQFGTVGYEGSQVGGFISAFFQHGVDVLDLGVDNLLSFIDFG